MANTSATGGYLTPDASPLDDDALLDFLQLMISGVTAMTPKMVRPAFQPNPAKRPSIEADWCAFWLGESQNEAGYEYTVPFADGLGTKTQRHETFQLRVTMYGPNAGRNARMLRDGLQLNQNREVLYLSGIAFKDNTSIVQLGELVDEQWYKRADITLRFSRQLNRSYSVLSFVAVQGGIITETMTIPWSAPLIPAPVPDNTVMSGGAFVMSGSSYVVSES